ncbi:MAG: hypothetical protein QW802_01180 [Candidatus Altiarchaeota archaeon]
MAIILLSLAYYFRPKLLTEKELKEAEEKIRIEHKLIIIKHEFSVRSGLKFGFGLALGIIVAIVLFIIIKLVLAAIFGFVILEKLGLSKIQVIP